MHWQYTPYIIPLLIAAISSGALALWGWQRRPAPGAGWFVALMTSACLWATFYSLEMISTDLRMTILWAKMQYVGIVGIVVEWLALVLTYTGHREWPSRRNVALLFTVPALTLGLVLTNEYHHLMWANLSLATDKPFNALSFTPGIWYWVNVIYAYANLLTSTALLVIVFARATPLYQRQIVALLIFALITWVGNLAYIIGLTPWGMDVTPITFSISGLLLAYSLFRYRILDVAPIARSVLIENMNDVVIVIDAQNRIVDLNPAAQALLKSTPSAAVGRPLIQFLNDWPDLMALCAEAKEGIHTEITLSGKAEEGIFDLDVTPLRGKRGQLTGRLMVMHDVTERRRAEAQLRLLLTLTRGIDTAPDFVAALHTALQLIVEHTGWIFGEAWLPKAGATVLENSGSSYYRGEHRDRLQRFAQISREFTFAPGAGLPGRVWSSGQPEWQHDVSSLPVQVYHRVQHGLEAGLKAALGVPVLVGEQVLAVLVFYMAEPRAEDQHLVNLVTAVATQLGTMLQQKRSDETLRLQAAALNTAANGIVITDKNGKITWVNAAFTALTGYSAAEVISQTPRLLKSGQYSSTFYEHIWKTLLAGEIWRGEIINRRRDGTLYTEEQTITPVCDEHGEISHFIAIKQDITARKEAEEELRQLSRAVEHSASTIVITDLEGNIKFVNPAFTDITGYTPEEAIGQNPRVLKSNKHPPEFYRELWDTISQGRIWRGEMINRKKNGDLYWESATISPVKDAQGRVTHYVAVKEDITARKKAEEALQQYAAALEKQNAELDAFAHTVAHDLKSPLTAIVGYSALLSSRLSKLSDEQKLDFLRRIKQSGDRMHNIVDELLLLARVREQKEIEVEPLDMEAIVTETQRRLEYMIEEYQAEIILPDQWPTALGYRAWVEEIWVNYLSNALKYGGRPPRVEFGATAADAQVRFWVRDNGNGLSPQDQARLFLPFEQLHQVRAEGHGLGLSIVQRIVEKLNGQVGIESATGKGSLFYFTLPAAKTR